MRKLLEFLLLICFHEWEIVSKDEVYPPDIFADFSPDVHILIDAWAPDIREKYNKIEGYKYTLRCKKCGEMKTYMDTIKYDKP